MSANNLSGDGKKWIKNKQFVQDLFKKVTDDTLPGIIKHFETIEKNIKKENKDNELKQVLNNCKEGNEKTVIHFAAARGDVQVFDHLVKEGCDINIQDKDGNNAFFTAVSHYHLDLVKYLIEEQKVDIHQSRGDDQQALHISSSNGDLKMCEYLISKGADVNKTSIYGKPINWACASQQLSIVKCLLDNGADVNGDKKQIPPPLILAVDFGNEELFNMLIKANADVNITFDEWSVLHNAAERGNEKFAKVLIEKGANPEFESKGLTALEYAKTQNQFGIVAYLREVTKKPISEAVEKQIEEANKKKEEEKVQKELSEEEKKIQEQKKEENKKLAAEKKELGNQHFVKEEIEQALAFYQEAIDLDAENVVYYSNKAACLIKQKKYQEALDTCQIARTVDPKWTKVFFREGHAYSELENYGDAAASYWEALRLEPDNKLYKQLFDRAVALGKKQNKERLAQQKK